MKFLLIVISFCSLPAFSQNDAFAKDSTAVRAVIDQLFEGMRNGDSSLVASSFHSEIQMITTFMTPDRKPKSMLGSAEEFKNAVGKPHDEIWDERISNVEIQLDGNLAQVWMDYSFYLDDKFSHCGVNAIQLIRTENGWKMVHLADTRRRTDCN